jgi:2-methylcitrate dehydratase PrpD
MYQVSESQLATERLASFSASLCYKDLPDSVTEVARQGILDWFSVTIAGANEFGVRIAREDVLAEGGNSQASLIYWGDKLSRSQAAMVNGLAAHILDYDDGCTAAVGHMSAPILAAVLALGQSVNASGKQIVQSYVAGYETASALGLCTDAAKAYEAGWHMTAVNGVMGAAAACANLLGLNIEQTRHAFGIAATQASGLKSMFGTMCKPLHAGLAAEKGLRAASLAQRNFKSCDTVIESPQGFASNFNGAINPDQLNHLGEKYYITNNIFKYHAACHLIHGCIEAALDIKCSNSLDISRIESVRLIVNPICLDVCNIQEPQTGLECKFSLRQTIALVLSGIDTADLGSFSDELARCPRIAEIRQRIIVDADDSRENLSGHVTITLKHGNVLVSDVHIGSVPVDLAKQSRKLKQKFYALVTPVLNDARCSALAEKIDRFEDVVNVSQITELTVPPSIDFESLKLD